jgi:hypothetical protein
MVMVMGLSNNDPGRDSDSDDDEELDQKFTPVSSSASSVEPVGPQTMSHVRGNEHSETRHFPGHGYPQSVDVRATRCSHPAYGPELCEQPSYVEDPSIGNHAPSYSHPHIGVPNMYATTQATSRRSSEFTSASEYGSPVAPAMYNTWPNSNAASGSSAYQYSPQPTNVHHFSGQIIQNPPYGMPLMDGLPRQPADTSHGDIFASRNVGQSAIQHQSAYSEYAAEGASLGPIHVKTEGGQNSSIPQ